MPPRRPHHTADDRYVHPQSGNKYDIEPKGLNIVWGNDPRYWKIPENGPAELIQVSWLEVSGALQVEKGKNYKVKFTVKVKEDGFGWNGTRVVVMAKVGKTGKYKFEDTTLTPGPQLTIPTEGLVIEVGQKVSDPTLYFGLYEVWSGKWKGGLDIIKAQIEPVEG